MYTLEDLYDIENHCGACDNYPGSKLDFKECPFKDIVTPETEWKKLGCKNFWD